MPGRAVGADRPARRAKQPPLVQRIAPDNGPRTANGLRWDASRRRGVRRPLWTGTGAAPGPPTAPATAPAAHIGKSVVIKGELSGSEDLIVRATSKAKGWNCASTP